MELNDLFWWDELVIFMQHPVIPSKVTLRCGGTQTNQYEGI
jgi:hypothetical protein